MPAKKKTSRKATRKTTRKSPRKHSRKAPRRKTARPKAASAEGERLQKVLAAAGAGSRRYCEELIVAGRVEVDREVVTELGTRVDPTQQEIRLDGVTLATRRKVYYALNKPTGVVCTSSDPAGRPRAIDLVPSRDERLFTVGRLDLNSEGLLLLTNDGELANQLTHPRYGVEKTYRVQVAGHATPEIAVELRKGIRLSDGLARVVGVTIKRRYKQSTIMEMVLNEGQNREIRRVMARVGHKVQRLVRIAVGPVTLGKLLPGEYRRLTREEVDSLRRSAKQS